MSISVISRGLPHALFWIFAIFCGAAHAADLVTIEGLDGEPLKNVEAYLGYAGESCESPVWRLEALYEQGPKHIREALEVFGYYDPEIASEAELVDGCYQARFRVQAGEPVRYRTVVVRIEGDAAQDPVWQGLLDANPLKVGAPVAHSEYEQYKQRFNSLARRLGYFDGVFTTNEVVVIPADHDATVTLVYVPGERYRFGDTQIDQDVVSEELVRRYVEFEPGAPFDARKVSDLYDSILISGYFALAEVRTVPRKDGSRLVDIMVFATPSKASTWTFGVGFGTDTGPQARVAYFNRRFNEKGHQWGARASASRVIKQTGLTYRIPLLKPRAEWLSFDGGYKDENTDTLESQQVKAGIKRLQRRGDSWLETQFIDLTNEKFVVAGVPGNIFYIAPGISWSQTRTSGVARPASGHRLTFQVSGTAEAIGSDLSFLQSIASGKKIVTLPADLRLQARLDLGATAVGKLQELPASLRFFAGGDFSVRGYDYKTLGPTDSTGAVLGGKNSLTASLEIDRLFYNNWGVAAFVDAGNAFDSYSKMNLQVGVGGGVRWFSPVGPIRLDIAFPLSDQKRDNFRLHISLSPDL